MKINKQARIYTKKIYKTNLVKLENIYIQKRRYTERRKERRNKRMKEWKNVGKIYQNKQKTKLSNTK